MIFCVCLAWEKKKLKDFPLDKTIFLYSGNSLVLYQFRVICKLKCGQNATEKLFNLMMKNGAKKLRFVSKWKTAKEPAKNLRSLCNNACVFNLFVIMCKETKKM